MIYAHAENGFGYSAIRCCFTEMRNDVIMGINRWAINLCKRRSRVHRSERVPHFNSIRKLESKFGPRNNSTRNELSSRSRLATTTYIPHFRRVRTLVMLFTRAHRMCGQQRTGNMTEIKKKNIQIAGESTCDGAVPACHASWRFWVARSLFSSSFFARCHANVARWNRYTSNVHRCPLFKCNFSFNLCFFLSFDLV